MAAPSVVTNVNRGGLGIARGIHVVTVKCGNGEGKGESGSNSEAVRYLSNLVA
jgi:hypothetical protein